MDEVKQAIITALGVIAGGRLSQSELEMMAAAAIKLIDDKNKSVAIVVLQSAADNLSQVPPPDPHQVVKDLKEEAKKG
jgi:hypothetical protein